jgi:cell division protein FtsL
MRKSPFILVVIGVNLFFVFFLVYKNSHIVELSFQKQQLEKNKALLLKEKDRLQQQLCVVQNKKTIKKFAKKELAMKKINPKQIKSLPETAAA